MIARSRSERAFNVLNVGFLCLVSVTMLYPFLNVLAQSFSGNMAIVRGEVFLWPARFTLYGYEEIIRQNLVLRALLNSVIITVVGTVLSMLLSSSCGFALSRTDLLGRKPLFLIYLLTMLFNGGLIPTFLVVRGLGLLNSLSALILPQAFIAFYMILMKNYFESISREVQEAAVIDGCNDLQIFYRVALPLSTPMLATIGLYYAVAKWNMFAPAVFYLTDPRLYPIQLVLREVVFAAQFLEVSHSEMSASEIADLAETAGAETLSMAVVIVATLPILALYPFLQRYFIAGIMLGSVKG